MLDNKFIIPYYSEQDKEQLDDLIYPYSDKFMRYDKGKHQYYLTSEALIEYGINIGDMQPDVLKSFIEKVTRAVYSYIKVKAGLTNYAKMMYRIAKGLGAKNLTKQDFRKIFLEDVLIVQAEKMEREGYAKDMPKTIVTEAGRTKAVDLAENDGYWLHDDVITTLDALNLTNSQYIKTSNINWSEY